MNIEHLRASGIQDEYIARLIRLKKRYVTHEVSELTPAAKYLEFVKFLVDSDRLHD